MDWNESEKTKETKGKYNRREEKRKIEKWQLDIYVTEGKPKKKGKKKKRNMIKIKQKNKNK